MAAERNVSIRLDLKPGDIAPLVNGVARAAAQTQSKVAEIFRVPVPPPQSRPFSPTLPTAPRSPAGGEPPLRFMPPSNLPPTPERQGDIFGFAADRDFVQSKAQAAQRTFSLAPQEGVGKAAAQKPQNMPGFVPTAQLATERDVLDKALLDAKRGLRDEAIKQLAAERRATLLAREKERLAPTATAAPLTGIYGILQRIGRLGEKVDPEVRLGAGKIAGMGFLAGQVGRTIGGGVGTGFANNAGGGLAAAGNAVATGMAGFAAGGPIGAGIALIPTAVEAIKDFASLPYERMAGGLRTLTGAMGELGGNLGAGGSVLSGMASIARLTPLIGGAMGDAVDSLKGALSAGTGMAALFSPGTMERFRIVQQDTMATIGRTFTPVLEVLTDFTRLAGDFLATVLPGTREMRDALSPLKDVFSELRRSLAEMAPVIKDTLMEGVRQVTPLFRELAKALEDMAPLIGPAIELLTRQLEEKLQGMAQRASFEIQLQKRTQDLGMLGTIMNPFMRLGVWGAEKLGIRAPDQDLQNNRAAFRERQAQTPASATPDLSTSAGMAARNISFTSSAEAAAHEVYQAAYRNAPRETTESLLASGNKLQEQANGILAAIQKALTMIGLGGGNGGGNEAPGGIGAVMDWAERATSAIVGAR